MHLDDVTARPREAERVALAVLREDGEAVDDPARLAHRAEVVCAGVIGANDLREAAAQDRGARHDVQHRLRSFAVDLLDERAPFRIELPLRVERTDLHARSAHPTAE